MSDHVTPGPDPLGSLLAPPEAPGDGSPLQEAVRRRTEAVLGRRRLWRRLRITVAVAAAYATGLATLFLLPGPSPTTTPQPDTARASAPRTPPPPAAEPTPAVVLEWRAFDSSENQAEQYRQAGKLYLQEENDPESALRCYSQALSAGGEQGLEVRPDDDWLLMVLKGARKKEKDDAKIND
jgi:hypothetical protein